MTRQLHALVYGDVNLNILDGSAIWVQSMAEALARSGVSTRVLLKAPVHNDRLVAPLQGLAGVTVIDPFTSRVGSLERMDSREPLTVPDAVRILGELDTEQRVDLVVVRGLRLVAGAARNPQLAGRLWTYLTDIPQNPAEGSPATWDTLDDIAAASRFMLCQTEELRSFLEAMVPGASGRAILWPPVVPEPQFDAVEKPALFRAGEPTLARPLRLVYTGKFAAQWNTLEMTDLPAALRAAGLDAELDMVGDKIHDEPDISGWSSQMETALKTAEGVNWRGGVPRQEAMRLSARADVGLSWRDPSMDASLELSTKVLEFASLGIPVLLNRTPMHERLLGSDYPLFASSANEIVAALVSPDLEQTLQLATVRAQASVKDFRMESAIARMRAALSRAFPPSPPSLAQATAAKPLKVGIASHDLKFFTRILEHLDTLQGVEVHLDEWSALAEHDESISKDLVSWADVIICEWAGPNLVWYSRNKRAHQRLIVRLHRFELEAGWLTNVDIDAVDQVVCVSPYYAHLTRERTGWPREKIVVVPNWVDIEQFDRPKLAGAPFVLGMIGISPHRKRPDLGVEVLSVLRRHDERFRLAIKSKLPWDYWWIWRRPEERIETEQLMNRLSDDPTVHDAVSFDGFGGDVATWLRRVGWVLSTSDDESFHLAPAEGMASGAVPALLPWPGADSIYDPHWIHADPAAIASNILEVVHSGQWDTQAALARDQVEASFPLTAICDAWAQLLISDASPDTADEPLYPH